MTTEELVDYFKGEFQKVVDKSDKEEVLVWVAIAHTSKTWIDNCEGIPVTHYGFTASKPDQTSFLRLLGLIEVSRSRLMEATFAHSVQCITSEKLDNG